MLASLAEPPLRAPGLVYEPKYDGIRAIVEIKGEAGIRSGGRKAAGKTNPGFVLYSRNGNDKTAQFPEIVAALGRVLGTRPRAMVLDGEIVAIDPDGQPLGFQHIQGRIHLTGPAEIERASREQPAALVLFDLLRDGADDLRGRPLAARRIRLQERIRPRGKDARWIRLSDIALDDGREMLSRAKAEGWEGLIVKEAQSPYHSGRRSPVWRKLKLLKQQEFVVGGWTAPRQTRSHFGSLLLGYYDERGLLKWAGAVGTGFDQHELDRVSALLRTRARETSPFADRFKTAEKAHWVEPALVVEVRFTEWTSDGLLRHPVYLGTREDKPAEQVRRETAPLPAKPAVPIAARYKKNRRLPDAPGVESAHSPSRPSHSIAHSRDVPAKSKPLAKTNIKGPPADDVRLFGAPALAALVDRLQVLEDTRKDGELELPNGDRVRVTNLAKVFWPDLKVTKGELLRYYVQVSPYLLPAVDDRPLVMKRFPNGVAQPAFYQQRHPETPPPGVRRELLPEDIEPIDEEGPRDRLIGGSLTTLLYMTQLAAISQDPWFSRVADPLHADFVAIDLDPGDGATFQNVLDVARWVKDEMDALGVPGIPKTSGSRGLHIYIPLPPKTTYESGQLLCHLIAMIVSDKHPKVATIERMVKRRPRGTVYVDYLQNILGKTLATAYSVRASDYAGVSTPLRWNEVNTTLDPRAFNIRTALPRFRKVGDLWSPLRTGKPVNLTAVLGRAQKLAR
jgi:bifunctional non-homologous end joining protein LigD